MFGLDKKQEFYFSLKYTECHCCCATMFCRWGCTEPKYPQGLRDYEHPRWKEIITIYLKYYDDSDTLKLKSNLLEEDVRLARIVLKKDII